LPWGYVTYFSFGLTGSYLGIPQKVSALDYTWTWDAEVSERLNETGASLGYDYTFTATNSETLDWTIELSFSAVVGEHMKVTHTVVNGYPQALTGVEFWYLFDLTHTPEPCVTTTLGTYYPPLYSALPDSVTWLRLSNQFQFDWRDADYPNGHAYLGDGSMLGVDVDILGVSLVLGDIASDASKVIDPYFSGVTRTWNAGAASYSGIAASWSPVGVPATGDNITFDGTSVFGCTWNTSVTLGDFTMAVGYSGTVTQASTTTFGVNNLTVSAGVFTASSAQYVNIYGNMQYLGGIVSGDALAIVMHNDASTIRWFTMAYGLRKCTLNGNTTVQSAMTIRNLIVTEDSTFTIAAGKTISITWHFLFGFDNQGEIAGLGTLQFYGKNGILPTITFGVINCPTVIYMIAVSNNNDIVSLGDDTVFGSTLKVESGDAVYSVTLALGEYDLSAHGITISTRGIINGCASTVTTTGAWSSSAGTYTPGTSTVELSGASTVTTGTGQSFYNLDVSGTYTTASSLNVTNDLTVSGGLTVGAGKTATWESDGEYSNTGTITGTGTLELSPTVDYSLTLGTVECPLVIGGSNLTELASDTTIENDVTVTGTLTDETHMTTFTDDCTLDFSTDSYLYNVTVQSGVTVTFADDILATRVVNSGTYSGGEFIEPLPEFTTTPDENAYVGSVWLYTWDQVYWDSFAVESMPGWMIYETDTHTFKAMPNATGFFEFSISLTWENMTTYQNITILVGPEEPFMSFDFLICFVILMTLLTLGIISLAVSRLRIIGLFVVFGVAIMAIPIILAFGDYYWIAVLFLLAALVVSVQSARGNAKGE